jgi:hypothetical protein
MIVELLNTGIETAIDRIGPEWHDLSKRAKDMGSAAVLLSLLLCIGIWVPPFFKGFSWLSPHFRLCVLRLAPGENPRLPRRPRPWASGLAPWRPAGLRQTADSSIVVSPVRMRTTRSTGVTKILPSPILPVRAALTMASTQRSTSSS